METRLTELLVSIIVSGTITFLSILSKMFISGLSNSDNLSEIDYTVTDELSLFGLSLTFIAFFSYRLLGETVCPAENIFPISGYYMFVSALCVEFILLFISVYVKGVVLRKDRNNYYEARGRWITAERILFWNLSGIMSLLAIGALLLLGRF